MRSSKKRRTSSGGPLLCWLDVGRDEEVREDDRELPVVLMVTFGIKDVTPR
jgi:hypothetical protein